MNVSALVGRLTRDMEFTPYENKNTGKRGYVAKSSIAIDREGRTGKNGEKQVDYIAVQSWITEVQHDKFFSLYMKKGATISINGSIRSENYTDKNNQNRTFTYVEGRMALVASPRNNNENGSSNQFQQGNQGGQTFQSEPVFEEVPYGSGGFDGLASDEIPF